MDELLNNIEDIKEDITDQQYCNIMQSMQKLRVELKETSMDYWLIELIYNDYVRYDEDDSRLEPQHIELTILDRDLSDARREHLTQWLGTFHSVGKTIFDDLIKCEQTRKMISSMLDRFDNDVVLINVKSFNKV